MIKTNPQATIKTYVTDSAGQRRAAMVTTKQYVFNRMKDFQWHSVSEFTARMSRDGLRGRLSEMTSDGYEIARRYDKQGRLTHVRLNGLPGIGNFISTP